jgi:hypothetical protein
MIKRITKRIILIALFLLISSLASAELCYIYIDKVGDANSEQTAKINKDEVLTICPYKQQYKPTKAELDRYRVVVSDLTEEVKNLMLESVYDSEQEDKSIVQFRKNKINTEPIKDVEQEGVVDVKVLKNNIVVKPIADK